MDKVTLVKALVRDSVQRGIRKLGLERTLEVIECIANIKQRLWMREAYYELTSK